MSERGTLYAGTSGFAYSGWSPRFYPPGARSNTWLSATLEDFRFVVKAQRGGSMRALGDAAGPTIEWLTAPYRGFGSRLGGVLYRVPDGVQMDMARLRSLLGAWPADLALVAEFQHGSWHTDEVFALLAEHRVVLCSTDLDDAAEPDLRLTGDYVYVRLRRTTYSQVALEAWAARLRPFLDSGADCYAFFRHDEHGESALRALELMRLTG
jgi:uncharacterized protein YecE (DUF72 family)